jgi:hypothetical protein
MQSFHSIGAPQNPITLQPQSVSSPSKDRNTLKQQLAQAEGHITMSKVHVASQRGFVAGLVRDGHDASQAQALLLRFEELQQLHIADRDRLRGELGE